MVFLYAFNSVAPIVLLILVGVLVRRMKLFDDHTLAQINRFNFRFPFRALMFTGIYGMNLSAGLPWRLIGYVMLCIVILTVIGLIASRFLTAIRARRGVLVQATFRSNYAIIGFALVRSLVGEAGIGIAAVFQLPAVVFFNLVSVILYSVYSRKEQAADPLRTLAGILKNPLIQGLLAGAVALLIRAAIPPGADGRPIFTLEHNLPWLYQALHYLANMATPMALVVLGAQLEIRESRLMRRELIGGVLMRLVAAPAIAFSLIAIARNAGWISFGPYEAAMMVALFGSPLAVSAMVMAQEMDADEKLAGQIVVWSSIFGMFSLFVIVYLLRSIGWL